MAHSVPKKVTPEGDSRKTSQPFTLTSAPTVEISLFPASSCSRVDFPAPFAPISIVREPGVRLKLRSTRHGGENVLCENVKCFADMEAMARTTKHMHLLLPKSTHTSPNDYIGLPLNFQIATNDVIITGYQLYAVEKWIVERNRPISLLVVYTGDPAHTITLTALVPAPHLSQADTLAQWDQAILHLRADGAKPKQTPHGVLMVTSLAHFRSDFTIVHIPGGNFLAVKDQLYTNINLLRMGCSGRSALTLDDPSDITKDRFISMYSLPETTQTQLLPNSSEYLPLPAQPMVHSQSHSQQSPTKSNFQQVGLGRPIHSHNRSTSSLPTKKEHGKTKERFIFIATVLELVKLIQAGLAIFGMYGSNGAPPNLILDGLLCDVTVDGIRKWIAKVGGPCVSLEPTERIADPMFVSALLSLVLSIRNKLSHLGYSHVLPKDPFLHPYAFSLALTAYIQTSSPPAILPGTNTILHPQITQPYALTTSSNYIPQAPTPTNLLSTAAAAAAAHTLPIGAILTRELVESISSTYDLKIKHESHKVRRTIRNRRAAVDSDGGADGEQHHQQQQRGREKISLSGGEGPRDGSPAKGGVGSSGGQILSGIGSLATRSGLRLGTGAIGDAGCIVNPTVDLTSFVNGMIGHKDSIRKVKERKKESVDLGPMIGISVGYGGREKDGVVGGSLKLLWSGRLADIVRMREMDMDPSSGTVVSGAGGGAGNHERDREGERDRDRWKRRRLPARVASDGELDDLVGKEKGRTKYDGRSTEEESDSIPVIPGHANSFSGMWSGRMRGKLGNWAGLARKNHQSVDLTTTSVSSKASPVIKLKDSSTPQNQNQHSRPLNKLVIGGANNSAVGNVSMSRQPSSSAQSPTLPPTVSSLEGDKYPEDDDLLSSGQVSPLSDYRPSPFKLNNDTNPTINNNLTNSNPTSIANVSTTNLSAPQALNSQDYENVLTKLLNKNKKRPLSLSQTARMSSLADPVSGREQEVVSGSHDERIRMYRTRLGLDEEEVEMESDISEVKRNAASTGIGKRKEKARFHSLLSVVDGEGVQAEKELEEGSNDGDVDWEEWAEGGRKGLGSFDPRRRRSFHDLETFKDVRVLSVERMMIDVEICGQLLIAWRREEHLQNVAACLNLLVDSLSIANKRLREHYESHMDMLSELESRSRIFTDLDGEKIRVDEMLQATNALRYESEQMLLPELWHSASASRHKVIELRDKVFGTDGRRLPRGMHGAHGKFNRLQWSIDGQKRLVDQVGMTESEAEEEKKIKVGLVDEEVAETEAVEHPGIKPMWLLRFFTRWSADQ